MADIDPTRWRQLSPLLDELLDLAQAERPARLEQIRLEDRALADELALLLAADAAAERVNFLDGHAEGGLAIGSLAGRTFGAYTLDRQLGQGGMGSVWLAHRSDGRFEGKAAIKFLNLALLGRGGAERFQREGNLLARLAHRNIAHLTDAGVGEDGQPFLVLEYVEGTAIDVWCDARALPIPERIRLFIDVLVAVGHAHSKLILHRDLKPSNIFVTADGEVKLLDFGIAKLIDEQSTAAQASELTRLAGRAYTPQFAAPEQLQGGDISTATDVYALGVIFYILLCGRHPTADPERSPVDQLRAVLETEPVPPSAVAERRLARELRGDLDNIAAKALKKAPHERYATVAEFAEDLRRYLNHEPVSARPDSLGYRVGKFVRRHRFAVAAVAITGIALVAGIAGTTWQASKARRAQRRAEDSAAEANASRETAQFEARVARANHEFVSQLFGDAMRGGESDRMRAQLDRARELLRRRYADDPVVHSLLLFQLAGRYAELNDEKREAEVMQEVEMLSERAADPSLSAAVSCIKAYDLIQGGDVESAKPHVAEGMRLMKTADRLLPVAGFECYRADAMLATATGDHARGVAQMEQWLRQLERDGLEKTRLYLNSLGSLAYIHYMAGNLVDALAMSRRGSALAELLGSEATLSCQIELLREAQVLFELGRLTDAIEVDRTLMRRFESMDPGGAIPAACVHGPARRQIAAGNADDGMRRLLEILPGIEREGRAVDARGAALELASANVAEGRLAQARTMLGRFEAMLTRGPPQPRERTDAARIGLAIALAARDRRRVRPVLEELEAALAASRIGRPSVVQGHLTAALATLALGDHARARTHAEDALAVATTNTLDGQGSAWVGAAHAMLARIDLAEDDRAAAHAHLATAAGQFADTLPPGHRWRVEAESLRGEFARRRA